MGGTSIGAANIISGNLNADVEIGDQFSFLPAIENSLVGNFIGTTASGAAPAVRIESTEGVLINSGAFENTIGPGNTIAGSETGIDLESTANNTITGNFIGTNVSGAVGLGTNVGVLINEGGANTIGPGNTISESLRGIDIESASFNAIIGNFIGTNTSGAVAWETTAECCSTTVRRSTRSGDAPRCGQRDRAHLCRRRDLGSDSTR